MANLHPIQTYSGEDRWEFLTRCRLLNHEWKEGDLVWDGLLYGGSVVIVCEIMRSYLNCLNWHPDGYDFEVVSLESDWLPLEGDIMDIQEWSYDDYVSMINRQSYPMNVPRLLSMLRVVRQDECACGHPPENGIYCEEECAGMHKENEPHLCLSHWKEGIVD